MSVEPDVMECTCGEVYVVDTAWSRWQEAVAMLGGPHKVLSTYGRMYQGGELNLGTKAVFVFTDPLTCQ